MKLGNYPKSPSFLVCYLMKTATSNRLFIQFQLELFKNQLGKVNYLVKSSYIWRLTLKIKPMKKFIAMALIASASMTVAAQNSKADWNPAIYQVGKIYPGYIINMEGDTIKGFLKALNRCSTNGIGSSNQNTAEFYLNETDKKPSAKYTPSTIKGYKIADKVYESIAYSGGLMKKPNFNLVIIDGAIRVYEWYATVENFNTLNRQTGETWQQFDDRRFTVKAIMAKKDVDPAELSMVGLQWVKKMPAFISDNQEMVTKVTNKEKSYTFIHIWAVIEEYNEWARTK